MNYAQSLQDFTLEVYSATWCPDCTRLKNWLEKEGIATSTVLIDEVDGAAEFLEAETGKRAIPFVRVNGERWVRGYHKELPSRFSPELFVQEIRGE